MAIDLGRAQGHANQLNNYASEIRTIRNNIQSFKNLLNCSWTAQEMVNINLAIDTILSELRNLVSDLSSEANDLNTSASEIREAEIRAEKERQEREERERADRERQDRERQDRERQDREKASKSKKR